MNLRALTASAAWISLLVPSPGCGPFFPDTVLDKPQAALDIPPVSYLHELYQLAGKPLPLAEDPDNGSDEHPLLRQIPLETAELRTLWGAAGVDVTEMEQRTHHYETVRQALLAPLAAVGRMDFPTHAGEPLTLPVRPIGEGFPADVADYVEAARLHASGNTAEARTLWKSILERPPAERKLRAVWAAWMLAKTSPNITECVDWYVRVETEAALGGTDVLGLRVAAKAWRAPLIENPVESIHLSYDALVAGKKNADLDLRRATQKLLASADPDLLAAAAADPLVRHLVNLDLHASFDGPRQEEANADQLAPIPLPWLSALEAHAPKPLDDGNRVAWALYSAGRYDEARRWLALSIQSDALGIWLQAKFDLRDGNLDAANQHLIEALRIQSQADDWHPVNHYNEFRWYADPRELQDLNQSRLLADAGIVSLAREDYLPALESLRKGGYREDAAYLAEEVISTDGLIKHVRKVAPHWTGAAEAGQEDEGPLDPYTCLTRGASYSSSGIGVDNQLRYLLARRLAREHRLKEAREFMPPGLLPILDHYIALDRARKSDAFSGQARAAVIWRQALIHRHLGAELFSTDGAPDGGATDWNFPGTEFSTLRTQQGGWSHEWDRTPEFGPPEKPADHAIPRITLDEISRIRRYQVQPMQRFHYRYAAADLAWEAAKALPANHPLLPRLYNTAGQWLAPNDPSAADRFYQALVRRCANTPEGRTAEARHWFLADLEALGDLPALPEKFRVAPARHSSP